MKTEKTGSNAFIEKIKTLNISTSKTVAQKAAESEPELTLQCPCGKEIEMGPTHAFKTPAGGKLVRYRPRQRKHDDSAERSLSA